MDVTDGGKRHLKLRVQTIELISPVDDADFVPPPDAVGALGERVSRDGLQNDRKGRLA